MPYRNLSYWAIGLAVLGLTNLLTLLMVLNTSRNNRRLYDDLQKSKAEIQVLDKAYHDVLSELGEIPATRPQLPKSTIP